MLLLAVELSLFWRSPEYVSIDFHAYAAAARVGEQSGWAHIYDQGLVKATESQLVPHQSTLRFISPPPVAWLAALLTPLPYRLAYGVWAALMFGALALAFAWSTTYRGLTRLVAVGVAIVPWWVLHALYVGQVVPLVAASVLIAWRLLREDRDVAGGIVLSLVVLKPQAAAVAPLALLAAGRYRAFAAWVAAAATVAGASLLTLGPNGLAEYRNSFDLLPASSSDVTLGAAFGLTGTGLVLSGALIVCAAPQPNVAHVCQPPPVYCVIELRLPLPSLLKLPTTNDVGPSRPKPVIGEPEAAVNVMGRLRTMFSGQ